MAQPFAHTARSLSAEQTRKTASALAQILRYGQVIALNGGLGSGKTCFVQGLANGLALDPDAVSSPTFTYVNEYACREGGIMAHMDMYRVNSADDIVNFAPDEYFSYARLSAVEWAGHIKKLLPADTLNIDFSVTGQTERELVFSCADESLIRAIKERLGQ